LALAGSKAAGERGWLGAFHKISVGKRTFCLLAMAIITVSVIPARELFDIVEEE
jgi:hypothetical protein